MKWTDEQNAAIIHDCAKDGSAIVSAAAGSGKTAVLVERIVRLLKDENNKLPADKIAAITFTVKAAGELRARLEKALAEEFAVNGSEWLEEQRIRLEDAKISTIDSFCIDIVRRYAVEAGYPENFRILDVGESTRYSARAMKASMNDFHSGKFSAEEREALLGLSGKTGDGSVEQAVLALDGFLMKSPRPLDNLAEKTSYYNNPRHFKATLVDPEVADIKRKISRAVQLAEENLPLCGATKAADRTQADLTALREWEKVQLTDPAAVEPLLGRKAERANFESKDLADVKEELKKNQSEYKTLLDEIRESAAMVISFDKVITAHASALNTLAKLYRIYLEYNTAEKIAAGGMTFSDAEQLCLDLLLKDDGRIAKELVFEQIIVDEFQDCNRLQCEIFSALNSDGKRLFYVGDVKQLIYRFRSSDPKIFTETMRNPMFKPLLLNKNFRSCDEVIDSVNAIFTGLMTEERGGVEYDEKARLEYGLEISGGTDYETELVVISGADILGGAEPMYIASRIRAMVDSGFAVIEKNNKQRRPVRYDDFAVIISKLSPVENSYIEAFKAYGVPYVRGGKGDFISQGEIDVAIDLLSVIDNPHRDDKLLNVLLSPLYGFTPNDAADVRSFGIKSRSGTSFTPSLFEDLSNFAKNGSGESAEKAQRFLDELLHFQSLCKRNSVPRLVRQVLRHGVFEPLAAVSDNPEKAFANLRLMEYYADNYTDTAGTLSEFAGFLAEMKEKRLKLGDADISPDTNTGTVKLLTIHASKGLEFPVCFVAETEKNFDKREVAHNMVFDEEIGFASRYIDGESLIRYETLPFRRAVENIKQALISEEIRKLYVAATRARDKLIFTALDSGKPSDDSAGGNNKKSPKPKNGGNNFYSFLKDAEHITTVEVSADDIPLPPAATAAAVADSLSADDIDIDLPYEREVLTKIPAKLTATQVGVLRDISMDEYDEPSLFPRNPSFMKDGGLTGKKRGDAYHKVMEIIDFKNTDYKQQIEDMKGFFTEEEFAAINPLHISGFFGSELGQRAAASSKVEKEFQLYTELSDFTELGRAAELNEQFTERPFIQGIADMFFYEGEKIILVDYKTNRGTTAEKLKAEYNKQLFIYKKAIEEMTGAEVAECYIYSFELGAILV